MDKLRCLRDFLLSYNFTRKVYGLIGVGENCEFTNQLEGASS